MEYGIDNKSKYTTLQIRTTLDCKRKERKAKKKTRTQIPPRGMGSGLERAYSKKIFFYYYWLQYQQTEISKTSWSLYEMKPRSYNFPKILNFSERGETLRGI